MQRERKRLTFSIYNIEKGEKLMCLFRTFNFSDDSINTINVLVFIGRIEKVLVNALMKIRDYSHIVIFS